MQPIASLSLIAVAAVRHRVSSRLLDGFDEWWQQPAWWLAVAAIAATAVALVRRDTIELPRWAAGLLVALRLGALTAVTLAMLDVQRIAEHEIALPSRVAVLVDTSASMSLADGDDPAATRAAVARDFVATPLLESLRRRHDVSVWRFDADAEPVLSLSGTAVDHDADGWRERLEPRGAETRLGEAVVRAIDGGPAGTLAGIVVVSDGGQNAGVDPRSAAARAERAGVAVHAVGVGSDTLPANVRVADLVAPARVFPGDRFAVSVFLQPQGLAGERVRVELQERAADGDAAGRVLDTLEAVLGGDGELVPVRFEVDGLSIAGRRMLAARVLAPAADRSAADDVQEADVEVVDRVTQVLLMAGGPTREYQFMRNVLERDKSFAVDVLLGTAASGISQDARRILDEFPASDDALGAYDAILAFDYDWRRIDAAGQARLDRWVAGESGGLVMIAGSVFADAWLDDARSTTIRGLHPLELRRRGDSADRADQPRPLAFTREGREAEFLWLEATAGASAAAWDEFPGVYACQPAAAAKPGATVLARLQAAAGDGPIYLAGQFYGSGSVLAVGSGELWRLRSLGDAPYERLVAQMVRHVSQGRLLRGARRGRLIVEQDRVPVGGSARFRLVMPAAGQPPNCRSVSPDGIRTPVTVTADPARPGTLAGSFVVAREGGWLVEVDPLAAGDERLTRRIQAQLPDRELVSPRLDRAMLARLAESTSGTVAFLDEGTSVDAVAEAIAGGLPDRSRRDYETGSVDARFKRTLNVTLLAVGAGCLCVEWITRRLARLA